MYKINSDEKPLKDAIENGDIKSRQIIQFSIQDSFLFGEIQFIENVVNFPNRFNIFVDGKKVFYNDMQVSNYIFSKELCIVCWDF